MLDAFHQTLYLLRFDADHNLRVKNIYVTNFRGYFWPIISVFIDTQCLEVNYDDQRRTYVSTKCNSHIWMKQCGLLRLSQFNSKHTVFR